MSTLKQFVEEQRFIQGKKKKKENSVISINLGYFFIYIVYYIKRDYIILSLIFIYYSLLPDNLYFTGIIFVFLPYFRFWFSRNCPFIFSFSFLFGTNKFIGQEIYTGNTPSQSVIFLLYTEIEVTVMQKLFWKISLSKSK